MFQLSGSKWRWEVKSYSGFVNFCAALSKGHVAWNLSRNIDSFFYLLLTIFCRLLKSVTLSNAVRYKEVTASDANIKSWNGSLVKYLSPYVKVLKKWWIKVVENIFYKTVPPVYHNEDKDPLQ